MRFEREAGGTAPSLLAWGHSGWWDLAQAELQAGSEARGWMTVGSSQVWGGPGTCSALATPLLSVKCLWGWLSGVVPEGCLARGPPKLRSEQEQSKVI